MTTSLLAIAASASIALAGQVLHVQSYIDPIDALSIGLTDQTSALLVRGWNSVHGWSAWRTMQADTEHDPLLQETNLVMFPFPVSRIEVAGMEQGDAVHPIRIPDDPITWNVAAAGGSPTPQILSREEWGADESFLYQSPKATQPDTPEEERGNGNGSGAGSAQNGAATPSKRITDCEQAQRDHPSEFKAKRTVTKDENGKRFRWAQQYSKEVKVLVVHHTAIKVAGDNRSGVERVRALYAYHANNRGWGDVGYHYLIDEDGWIYEGRAGGDYVVGGHAYCNNIGTVGVALLGNFDVEKPSQSQMKSLQWLLHELGERYDIDLTEDAVHHGQTMPPIVGHGDLVSTECPGYYVDQTLSQVRTHVASGNLTASIDFPVLAKKYTDKTAQRKEARSYKLPKRQVIKEGFSAMGDTSLQGRPGSETVVSLRYRAGNTAVREGTELGAVERSEPSLQVWNATVAGAPVELGNSILAPSIIPPNGTTAIRLKIQFPMAEGKEKLTVGGVTFTLDVSGRRARTGRTVSAGASSARSVVGSIARSSAQSNTPTRPTRPARRSSVSGMSAAPLTIRIQLTELSERLWISVQPGSTINGKKTDGSEVFLSLDGTACAAKKDNGTVLASGIVRIDPGDGTVTVSTVRNELRAYRGIVECRVVDGVLTLINKLGIEPYLMGLAEEPDTEPYQKQRAFAIAARTYAAYYADPAHRKFPGKPYDGSDSAAIFQAYGGANFETQNPAWQKAVRSTQHLVLTKDGEVIRAPYFSSDDGRTKSPAEVGWKNFPFAEIFASKADPWCTGMENRGHGVGMSGCGAEGQANEGKSAEEILGYYYPGTELTRLSSQQ